MAVFGLMIVGVALGAAGVEFLRAKNPELLEKIEARAKRFVDGLDWSEPEEEKPEEEKSEEEKKDE